MSRPFSISAHLENDISDRVIETSRPARRGGNGKIAAPVGVAGRYEAGESELALSRAYGVDRGTVARWLIEAGVDRRGRSAAMYTRMGRASTAERKRLAGAANIARRGGKAGMTELFRKAQARPRRVGRGEAEIISLLLAAGISCDAQQPVGPYNIDIGCWPVAVEVHRKTDHPSRAASNRERVEYLADHDWTVLYVWCYRGSQRGGGRKPTGWCLSAAAAREIVTHVQAAQVNPAAAGKYRVIRCTGEDAA